MPLTRQPRCPSCGATEDVLSDALLVFCSYCGALVALESSQCWSGDNLRELARRHRRQLIAPTASDARKTWLLRQLERCRLQEDRPGLRAAAREYYSLLALTDPELVPGAGQSDQALQEWLACAVAEYELLSFDPQIKAAYAEMSRIGSGLCRSGDPVGLAGEMLAAAGRYYTLLIQHPDYPLPQHSRTDELAKSMVRAWVTPQAAMMAKGQAVRIFTEVLGDQPAAAAELRCPSCGARLPPATEGAQQCPYCGGVLRLGSDDPWLSGLLSSWQVTADRAADEATLAAAALLSPLQSYQISGEAPTATDCYRFLRQAVPWLSRELLLEKLQLYRPAYEQDPQLGPMFSQLEQLLASWQPSPRVPTAIAGKSWDGF